MNRYKTWTDEDKAYLQDYWGSKSIKLISRHLGRSYGSVQKKAAEYGLGSPRLHYDGITVMKLSTVLGVSASQMDTWIKDYNFPAKQKVFSKKARVNVVSYQDFWEWASAHRCLINLSKMDPLTIGKEPDWAKEKRRIDRLKFKDFRLWEDWEIKRLKSMVNSYTYTFPEISTLLQRSEISINTKLTELGIMARPLSLDKHVKYTDEEVDEIVRLLLSGYSFNAIADKINLGVSKDSPRSARGIRGKLERMGFSFRGDMATAVPIKFKEHAIAGSIQ